MLQNGKIYLGLSDTDGARVELPLSVCNRHGLIAGASGTGKTITMKVLAEAFSDAGVPVFLCDIKGDVSGLCLPGEASEGMEKRIDKFSLRDSFCYKGYPVCFWDVYGETGHPVRTTISDMGPELLSRILGLSEAQEGVLSIAFKIADDKGLLLYDMKDLRALLNYVSEHRTEYTSTYGAISTTSLFTLVRTLLPLETQGGDKFFGEPPLDIRDWLSTDPSGNGIIHLLDCVKLAQNPTLYATFLLWMMSELYTVLPEVGDADKPKLVFFFDEAHMLFSDAPRALVQKIEQVVKLIRSKGVGLYFVTQNPADIPDSVLAQLSNRVQHALRAYTPAEQRAVRAAADSMRPNPAFSTEQVIMELGVGHALVSVLDEEGVPGVVQQTSILCPQSLMAPADPATREQVRAGDGMSKYDTAFDSETAFELLEQEKTATAEQDRLAAEREAFEKEKAAFEAQKQKEAAAAEKKKEKAAADAQKKMDRRMAKIETQLIGAGAQVIKRTLFKTLFK